MNFYEIPKTLEKEIQDYEKLVSEYKADKVNKVKFKAVRVPMGIYEQREVETYMCRIRLPGGAITPEQLIGVAKIAEKYSDRPIHFTTRGEGQVHHVELEKTVLVLKELRKIGLATRGGGGNTVRNIIGEATAGISEDEVFDVSPYVQALTSRLIAEKDSWSLPRKFKIAFSGSSADRGLATINDLGFIAKLDKAGKKGFKVYIAGGMGGKPSPSRLLYKFISEAEVYNVAKAAKSLFDKYGNRKNKHAARLRFLYAKLGKEEFEKKYKEELKDVRAQKFAPLEITPVAKLKKGSFELPLFLGDMETKDAIALGQILQEYGDDVLRVTTRQNILLRNLETSEIEKIKEKLKKAGILKDFPPLIGSGIACAGASTCRLGICLSRGLIDELRKRFVKEDLSSDKIDDLSLNISGCPNSCGQHPIGNIGLFGVAKRKDNRMLPCYTLVIGGHVEEDKTQLAQKIEILPSKAIPAFLLEFLRFVQESRQEGEVFVDYLSRVGQQKIAELAEKYASLPTFEEGKDYYYDWSADEPFSILSKVEGECSAGLFDLIDWDFDNITLAFAELKKNQNSPEILRSIVVYASRALLVTKGLEAKTEPEAVALFKEHFIGRHIEPVYATVLEHYASNKELKRDEVQTLVDAVKGLYDAMDDSLRFPKLLKEVVPEAEAGGKGGEKKGAGARAGVKSIEFRDFRGVACPMNFVKTKLVLETMKVGEQLEVLLDDGEPMDNVPASVKADGHKVVKQDKIEEHWSVLIEKAA